MKWFGALAIAGLLVEPSSITMGAQVPRTILVRGDRLAESKRAIARKDPALMAALQALKERADQSLVAEPLSVMQKKRLPPSGNKHDYMSMAPYWWPDSSKADGLPFVRHDGLMFPESRVDHDGIRLQQTIERVQMLALAWYLTGETKYANGAAGFLRVFFLDSATRMNPNLEYAQAVLGVNSGRGIGIIDTRTLPDLVDALRILDGAPNWTSRDSVGMTEWCRQYLRWMLTSKNGKAEQAEKNNHGVFHDEQVAALALYVSDSAVARATLDSSVKRRIDSQIKADGTQPLELERTRPMHYSIFNLDAFTMLAEMARNVGVDLWHYTSPGGGSIEKALRYIAPYSNTALKFPKPDVEGEGNAIFLLPLRRGAAALSDRELTRDILDIDEGARRTDVSRFAFPGMP